MLDAIYGIDVAIKKLRPYANFQLEGTSFTIWNDPTGTLPPTWAEVIEQYERDKEAYDRLYNNEVEIDVEFTEVESQGTDEETPLSKRRLVMCESCDSFKTILKVCNECHCFMPLKARMPSMSCPLGKW